MLPSVTLLLQPLALSMLFSLACGVCPAVARSHLFLSRVVQSRWAGLMESRLALPDLVQSQAELSQLSSPSAHTDRQVVIWTNPTDQHLVFNA